jgi:hypothetical protein
MMYCYKFGAIHIFPERGNVKKRKLYDNVEPNKEIHSDE